jgi:hypothetical protein
MVNIADNEIIRDKTGRFLKGKIGGPGRPIKHAFYQAIFDKEFNKKEYQAVIRKLYELAIDGDIKAITIFMDRCMGKVKDEVAPVENHDQAFLNMITTWRNNTKELNHEV